MKYRDILLGLSLCAAGATVGAATAVEERVFSTPMPHEAAGGAQTQNAIHYVRLEGKRGAGLAGQMRKLIDSQLKNCTAINGNSGKPINLPKELPDFERHYLHDTYYAPNRTIQYRRSYVASVNLDDCSLDEREQLTAVLTSSKGRCRIDLVEKTARGVCDGAAHADAPVRPASSPDVDPNAPAAALDPQVAAVLAHMTRSVPKAAAAARRGEPRRVAGAPCEQIATANGGTACVVPAPSFPIRTSLGAVPDGRGGAKIILASTAVNGELTEEATQAKFDRQVSDSVFGPYLRGGFKISGGRQ